MESRLSIGDVDSGPGDPVGLGATRAPPSGEWSQKLTQWSRGGHAAVTKVRWTSNNVLYGITLGTLVG
jgi:hypothetical protein